MLRGSVWLDDIELEIPKIDKMLEKYQDPREVDKMMKLQSQLKDIKGIVTKTMDQVYYPFHPLDPCFDAVLAD